MKPLVSILIPCYNSERWIAETLASAVAQTWQDKEIIVVDDGSTDGSLVVAKSFESPLVKVISQENSGASMARNRALEEAQGDFIQYLDADDLLNPQKIEEQVILLQQNPPGVVAVCGTVHFYDGEKPEKGILEDDWPIVDSDDPLNWLIELLGGDGRGGMVHPGAWLVPRIVADAAGLWVKMPPLDDDGEYFARVVLASTGIRRAKSGISYYRKQRSGNNLTGGRSEQHYWSILRSTDLKAQTIFARTDEPRAKRALARCYTECAFLAYPDYPAVTETALRRVKELGGTDYLPSFGSWKGQLINRLFGWKVAKEIYIRYRQYIVASKRLLNRKAHA